MNSLNTLLNAIVPGEAANFNDLRIVPLFSKVEAPYPYLEIDAALKDGLAEITEVSEQGSVPDLRVVNKSDKDVVIFDGEELVGAKQNRIVNLTIVVPAFSTVSIPVTCVEQGRWHFTSRSFASGASFLYPSLRREKHQDVTENLRRSRAGRSDQGKVWRDISLKAERMGVHSDTMAMADIYDRRAGEFEKLSHAARHLLGQVGYAAYVRGGFAGCDVFGTSDVCRRKLPKLLRSYYLDSLDHAVKFPPVEVGQLFEQLAGARHERFDAVGKGAEMRFNSHDIQGSWKEVNGHVLHLTVFPLR